MKKILLTIMACVLSVMTWAQNPYAYGLSSKLSDDKQTLTVTYSLNANATSAQILVVDANGNTCLTQDATAAQAKKGTHSIEIPTASLPTEKALNCQVVVNGGNATAQPTAAVWAVEKRPNSVHGVAVNNDQQSANFGKIYVAEAMMTTSTSDKWSWLNGNVPALLEYNQDLSFKAFHKKSKQNGTAVSNFSTTEPNRVRVSADGRIFVASYHNNSTTAVYEYTGDGNYNTIIPRTAGSNLHPTSIDVKGSGKDLKLLVTYYDSNVDETNMIAKVYCYEYPIGTSTSQYTATGTLKAQYNDHKTDPTLPGLLYQAVKGGWFVYTVGMINAVYGDNDMIWMKIDFYVKQTIPSKVIAFNSSKTTPLKENDLPLSTDYYYGGDGIVVKGNLLVTGNNCAMHFYQTNTNGSITKKYNDLSTIYNNTIYTNIWINDLAIDHANNLYAVSAYAGNMMVVALPNGGKTITNAANKYAFTLPNPIPPVANIMATALQQTYDEEAATFTFSFIANELPTEGEIRFYLTADPTTVADVFPITDLKKGLNSITIPSADMPQGECNWSVYLQAKESEVFAPIYTQNNADFASGLSGVADNDPHRAHAAINTYPETDQFGHIYVANHHNIVDVASRKHSVASYALNHDGNYALQSNLATSLHYSRRPAVAPDGMVYLVDEGSMQTTVTGPENYDHAGLWILNPADAASNGTANLTPFLGQGNYEATSAVAFLGQGAETRLYKTNTFEDLNNVCADNGYVIYPVGQEDNTIAHAAPANKTTVAITGDIGGNFSIAPTAKGVWLCLHRDVPAEGVAGDEYNTMLMCYDNKGKQVFTSHNNTAFHQHVKATPGAGMTVSADGKYLYIVNHEGNIVKYAITWENVAPANVKKRVTIDPGQDPDPTPEPEPEPTPEPEPEPTPEPEQDMEPTLTYVATYSTNYNAISSLALDYAGNIIATAGSRYGNSGTIRDTQLLVVYTQPNANNHIEVPASAKQIIPSREVEDDDDDVTTSIDMIEQDNNSTAEKFIHNGQLYIRRGNTIFSVVGNTLK